MFVELVVFVVSVSPFNWPCFTVVITDFMTTEFADVSLDSLESK